MNAAWRTAWSAAVGAARLGSWIAARAGGARRGKLARSLALRDGVRARIAVHASRREAGRPLLWLHAPSVGEGLQARPLLRELRQQAPHAQLAYTYFSPSAQPFAQRLLADGLADWVEVLPFDGAAEAEMLLSAWQPSALIFVKLDVWPVLSERAAASGVPTALVSATLAPNSSRQGGVARALLHDAYAALRAVGAISADDAERLVLLGAHRSAVHVTGDTRMDQVAARTAAVGGDHPVHALLGGYARPEATARSSHPRDVLVAGSTWPADEAVLLPAFEQWRAAHPRARLIIAPHEPTASHLEPIITWARRQAISLARLGEAEADPHLPWEVLLVDRVGVLGELYALADRAFVGGGFHSHGLHSVLEPAAYAVPVLFGPKHYNAREAAQLLQSGGAAVVRDSGALAAQLARWSAHQTERAVAGAAARQLIDASLGSTGRVLSLLDGLLPGLLTP